MPFYSAWRRQWVRLPVFARELLGKPTIVMFFGPVEIDLSVPMASNAPSMPSVPI